MKKEGKIVSLALVFSIMFGVVGRYSAEASTFTPVSASSRFNANITVNDIKVGGLTADQALKKLESSVLKNQVYVGQQLIFDGTDTTMGFTNQDLPSVQKLLRSQLTLSPSSKSINYSLIPASGNLYRSQTLKNLVENKLITMNKNLKAPKDAQALLVNGKAIISKSEDGQQYDVSALLQDYQKQEYNSDIHLNPVYLQPIKADSTIVKNEEKMLQQLVRRTVNYTVQNKVYSLKASDLIKNASVSKNMNYTINSNNIKNQVAQINSSQSTLNKNFLFKTHSGSVISVPGQSYGWAINVAADTNRIQDAFENGQPSVSADVYGIGWNTHGIGYDTIANHGIGNTYAEVSIEQQRIWLYKNGQLVVTTNVVTGRHDVGEDTPKGVWYIMYKQSPATLVGSEVGNPHYSVPVQYWAPFTDSGCGFHDASWRTNWSSTAYLHQGSGGCVNTPPSVMKTVYDNLSQNEPVVIY